MNLTKAFNESKDEKEPRFPKMEIDKPFSCVVDNAGFSLGWLLLMICFAHNLCHIYEHLYGPRKEMGSISTQETVLVLLWTQQRVNSHLFWIEWILVLRMKEFLLTSLLCLAVFSDIKTIPLNLIPPKWKRLLWTLSSLFLPSSQKKFIIWFDHPHMVGYWRSFILPDWGGWGNILGCIHSKWIHEEKNYSRNRAHLQSSCCGRELSGMWTPNVSNPKQNSELNEYWYLIIHIFILKERWIKTPCFPSLDRIHVHTQGFWWTRLGSE